MATMATERRTAEQVYELQRRWATARTLFWSATDEENMAGSPLVERRRREFETLDTELDEARSEIGGRVYRVPDENLHGLEQRVAKINRRAAKLDVEPVHFDVTSETWELVRRSDTTGEVIEVVPHTFVVVGAQVVKLAGWRFAATIEHDEEGNIIRQVPGVEADLSEYRTAAPWCFHCRTTRRRIDTFVVLHDDGHTEQVGRNCLVDFLGSSAKGAAAQAEWLHDLFAALDDAEDAGVAGARGVSTVGLEEFLTHVALEIREHRWVSRGVARDYGYGATADIAASNLDKCRRVGYAPARWDRDEYHVLPEPRDAEMARVAIEWARATWCETPIDERDDFEHNMAVAVVHDYVPTRRLGLAAYAVQGYLKTIEETVRREAAAVSEFVGTVGERLRGLRVKVARVVAIADRYSFDGGTKPLYTFVDEGGNSLKWFASANAPELAAGEEYLLTGTVKRHEDDAKFGKATIITRCKVEEVKS